MKGFVLTLALPPVCFLYLVLAGLALGRWYRRPARVLLGVGLIGLTLLSLPIVADGLVIGLERDLPLVPPANAMPEAIVILGGDLSRVREPPFARSGALTLDRLRAGAALHRRSGLPILVTGGLVQIDRPAVATVMATSLREDFQVPVTWVEDASVDTWENARLSAIILKQRNIRSVYVVTQGWHMRRAVLAFQHAGLIVTAAPTSLNPPLAPVFWDFLPHATAWEWSYYGLHEWIGWAWYAFRQA